VIQLALVKPIKLPLVRPRRGGIAGASGPVGLVALVLLVAGAVSGQSVVAEEEPQAEATDEVSQESIEIRAPAVKAPADSGAFRIGVGDILGIHVWREPEVTVAQVSVRTDGKISMPLIKEVHCVGLTPLELDRELTLRLSEYINAPEVSVIVKQINSLVISMIGGVMRPGKVPMSPGMTALEAIAGAGGLTDFAKRKKIYVLRREGGQSLKIPFDYDGVVAAKKADVPLHSGDIIIIPD